MITIYPISKSSCQSRIGRHHSGIFTAPQFSALPSLVLDQPQWGFPRCRGQSDRISMDLQGRLWGVVLGWLIMMLVRRGSDVRYPWIGFAERDWLVQSSEKNNVRMWYFH
ncbi:hypothetical protein BJX61DRAFT_319998 [Aspergillus egyptiacus]|nr:hypothetical protein BJX61DRAFT_319998 [Aspergillus egyptiacus]